MQYFSPRALPRSSQPVQFLAFKFSCVWPQRAGVSIWARILHIIGLGTSLFCYMGTLLAEFSFMSLNASDIPAMTDCLSTSFLGLQYFIRSNMLAIKSGQLRALLELFYAEIYISTEEIVKAAQQPHQPMEVDNPNIKSPYVVHLNQHVARYMRYISAITNFYYVPMMWVIVMFVIEAVQAILNNRDKPYIYRSEFFFYNAQKPLAYIITSFYMSWLSFSCVGIWSTGDYLLSSVLCHTSQRYKELQLELTNLLDETKNEHRRLYDIEAAGQTLHVIFQRRLYKIFQKQQRLYEFVRQAKTHFSLQIFSALSFGVFELCVLMFQFQKTEIGLDWSKYIIWVCCQVGQFLLIGFFGQLLMDESLNLRQSYYNCRWESLLAYGDIKENASLMRDLQFAIMNATNPVVFDGIHFFSLTHGAIGTALRSAMSYFMFLNTMNDPSKK